MPNQRNYLSNVSNREEPRFLASRIVRFPTDEIYFQQVPASFGHGNSDNIEIHFYSIPKNELILTLLTGINNETLKSHIVAFDDNTYKNYIQIDFTKVFEDNEALLIPGDYRMVINFFSDELGSYTNRNLIIDKIGNSRTEIEVSLQDNAIFGPQAEAMIKEFVELSFGITDAVGLVEKIFKSGIVLSDESEGLTAESILRSADATAVDRLDRLRLTNPTTIQLNEFVVDLFTVIREKMVTSGDQRIQQDEFEDYIEQSIAKNLSKLQAVLDSRIKIT